MSSTSAARPSGNHTPSKEGLTQPPAFVLRKGLDLPITGQPDLTSVENAAVNQVALLGADYVGLKPTMAVKPGDRVKRGQTLFTDKRNPGINFTSPASGTVSAINRGKKRVLLSVVIDLEGKEEESFASWPATDLDQLSPDDVRTNLLSSGLWTALRTRPYSKVPAADSSPQALFINTMDTNPLAAPPQLALQGREDDFRNGLRVLTHLTSGKLHLCHPPGETLPGSDLPSVSPATFEGPHPAGLAGTHIHFLHPASPSKTVWYLGLQEVIAIGTLFTSGRLDVNRLLAIGGSSFLRPRLKLAPLGANINDLTTNELRKDQEIRIVSGTLLYGHAATGPLAYLGRHHLQISAIQEGRNREFLEWHRPGLNRFSVINTFLSKLIPGKRFPFNTSTGGGERPMVPIGMFEKVMPLDLMITPLLRALLIGDNDQAQALGCLELDEEDLALCTFACPGKEDYATLLRKSLTSIEADG